MLNVVLALCLMWCVLISLFQYYMSLFHPQGSLIFFSVELLVPLRTTTTTKKYLCMFSKVYGNQQVRLCVVHLATIDRAAATTR